MNKKLTSFVLALSLLGGIGVFHWDVSAKGTEQEVLPFQTVSEDFFEEPQAALQEDNETIISPVPPISVAQYLAERANSQDTDVTYPAVYDPRMLNKTTPVRNQKGGTCQIYAATANLEMFNITHFGDASVLSEMYFDFLSAFDAFGGTPYNAYARGERKLHSEGKDYQLFYSSALGYGPVLATQFASSVIYPSNDMLFNTPPHETIYNFYQLPALKEEYTPEAIQARVSDFKGLITQNGSFILYNQISAPYTNKNNTNVYIPIQEGKDKNISANHAVTVVGWDDNYSKNNFSYTPSIDGAFIVKNSWGSSSGNGGYFYLSYEDYFVCATSPSGVTDASLDKRYDHLYTHIQYSSNDLPMYSVESSAFWTANVFDIEENQPQQLESFGIGIVRTTTDFEVYLNQNVRAGAGNAVLDPQDMVKIYTGHHDNVGYHTIALDHPITLDSPNGKFAIVVKYNDDGDAAAGKWKVCGERTVTGSNSGITYLPANAGESYYAIDNGAVWTDTSALHKINFTLNAYTNDIDANSNNPLCIQFAAPGNWGDSANLTLYNAGDLSGQTVSMEQLSSGGFIYRNDEIRQATFTIDDGTGGHKTSYLYACGSAKVENDAVSYTPMPMQVDFKKPDDWTGKAKIYYYSDDASQTPHKAWPGENMASVKDKDGWYRYYITDMQGVRILFTDGNKQYPNLLKDGITLKTGQDLIWQDGGYLYNDRTPLSVHFYPPKSLQNYSSFVMEIKNGDSSTEGVLQDSGKGYFEYTSDGITRGNLTIYADGGRVIYDTLVAGRITVNGTKLYRRPKEPIQVRFQPPAGWSKNVSIYYYTDDQRYIEHSAWPGETMNQEDEDWYTYTITDMDNVRILFTDSTHQLPAMLQEGQPASSGQSLIFQNKTCIYDDGETPLDVQFYKPDNWDDTIYITVRELGSDYTPSSMMEEENGNLYVKRYAGRTSGEITISDTSGHQTKKLIVAGCVTVSQNTAVQRPKTPIPVTFEKPAGWGNNISMYVFTNDDSYTSFAPWPGTAMTKEADGLYHAEITDTNNARVFFSDGTNQYPLKGAPLNGVPVKEGQSLYANGTTYRIT